MLRAEFVEDYTDSTTGNGLFLQEHDRGYSVDMGEQVTSYFLDVSGGRQEFQFDVFPGNGGAYGLPHQMGWYGGPDRWPVGVIWILVHAVQAADEDVDFSEYDAVMVVHAGAGLEADVAGNSPWDISSMFINYDTFQYYLSAEDPWLASGIPTNDGVLVKEGMVVPEHQTQDGYGLGVLGTICHKLMRRLGAPDLYNTFTGQVAIGGWDIMGYGQWIMYGFWPSAPGAFTRERLGWAQVQEIWEGDFTVSPGDTVYRVPLSGTEYLLIENRQRDPDGNGLCGAHERDFGLPGSGVVIWHVDETRLGVHVAANTVNADPGHQGVSVVEADGIPDFNSAYYDAFYTSEGSQWDPWKRDGYAWLLGPETTPSTSASWGGRTGVAVDVTSISGNTMGFTVSREEAEGWPVTDRAPRSGLTVWNAPGLGEVIAALREGGRMELYSSSGESLGGFGTFLSTPPAVAVLDGTEYLLTGDRNGYVHMLTPEWGQEAPGWPVKTSSEPSQVLFSGDLGLAAAVSGDSVHLWEPGGEAIQGWPRRFDYPVLGICVAPDPDRPGIAATTSDGSLACYDLQGGALFPGGPVHPGGGDISAPVSSDFDRDGEVEIALTSRGHVWCYDMEGGIEPGFPAQVPGTILGGLFPADLNGNGFLELVVETSTGAAAFTASGTFLADWPMTTPTDTLVESSDRFNYGAGGSGFIALSLRDGRTGLWGPDGGETEGSVWSLGDGPRGRPVLWRFQGEQQYRLTGISGNGWITGWPVSLEPQGWHTGMDRGGEGCWWPRDLPPVSGSPGLDSEGFFVWPNPVTGGAGFIRFTPPDDCTYTIRVFNVAGDLVGLFRGEAPGGSPWEVPWNTSRLSPGLYYVCLRVEVPGESIEALFHAAVVN
jgi:M6 family metalloprotease-like protein